ncbi:MAG: hypothetical protein PHG35_00610 [Dehalococcoidales bacterium]|nr:hypothetical protein [Dehalococcoidales bacterium]
MKVFDKVKKGFLSSVNFFKALPPVRLWQLLAVFALVALMGVSAGLGYSLARISGELEDTKTDLASTQTALADTRDTLLDTQNELASTEDSLTAVQNDLTQAIIDLGHSQAEAADYAAQLAEVQSLYDNLSQGYSFIANNISYLDVINFLAKDKTDLNLYNSDTYTCFNFTADVISSALEQHIWCGFTYIRFTGGNGAHALVAFNTSDRGIVYFEPQTDDEATPEVGKQYWTECFPAGLFNSPANYDDTIEYMVIIW